MSRDTVVFFSWWIPLLLSIGWADRFIREHSDANGLTISFDEMCWLLALPAGMVLGIVATRADRCLRRAKGKT